MLDIIKLLNFSWSQTVPGDSNYLTKRVMSFLYLIMYYVCTYVCVCTCAYVCEFTCVFVCVCIHMRMCGCVCECVCTCVCICMCLCVHTGHIHATEHKGMSKDTLCRRVLVFASNHVISQRAGRSSDLAASASTSEPSHQPRKYSFESCIYVYHFS